MVIALGARACLRQLNQMSIQQAQTETLQRLLAQSQGSQFAKDHDLHAVQDVSAYRLHVPLTAAESLWQRYLENFPGDFDHRLTRGPVDYLARTSGSSLGQEKYMPVTPLFLKHLRQGAFWQGVLNYLRCAPLLRWRTFSSPWLWLTDLSDYTQVAGYPTAMISRIVREGMGPLPRILPQADFFKITPEAQRFQALVPVACAHSLGALSGITPWVLSFCEYALDYTRKRYLHEIWPHLQFIMHAGVDFAPYRQRFLQLLDRPVHFVENYVATEGFLGIQDLETPWLRCLPRHGVFYEFVPLAQLHQSNPVRYALWEVETHQPYAMVVSNLSGFWSVPVGDVVQFEALHPYPLFRVLGRTQDKCDFFGEKLLLSELAHALQSLCDEQGVTFHHFAVGPHRSERHLTVLLEVSEPVAEHFAVALDTRLQRLNRQYARNRQRHIQGLTQVIWVAPGGFQRAFAHLNPQHLQGKVPQLFQDPEGLWRYQQAIKETSRVS